MSEKHLIRLTFWDTLWEQFCLSDQSALLDASLGRKPFKPLWARNGLNISQFKLFRRISLISRVQWVFCRGKKKPKFRRKSECNKALRNLDIKGTKIAIPHSRPFDIVRGFEKGLADRGGWARGILPMPEIHYEGISWERSSGEIFADAGEKRSENLAKKFADFCPLISSKSGCKKFHEKSSTFSTRDETKFFHREIPGGGLCQRFRPMPEIQACFLDPFSESGQGGGKLRGVENIP